MTSIRSIVSAVILGVVLYLITFIFLVHKPLTVGIRKDYLTLKMSYLSAHSAERKIVLLAGSNGRFSHRCETIEQVAHAPCINMSVSAGVSLKWQYSLFRSNLHPGDLLYLPIEYPSAADVPPVGDEAPYLVEYRREDLRIYSTDELAHALFYFDLRYFISATGEMLLASLGTQRRFSAGTLTAQGDESGHTAGKGLAYRQYMQTAPGVTIQAKNYLGKNLLPELGAILDDARRLGIIVVGGLPTLADDSDVPAEVIELLRNFYSEHGQCFIALPNHSQYPRRLFYDSIYHLNEEAQKEHSALVATRLRSILENRGCPSPEWDKKRALSEAR